MAKLIRILKTEVCSLLMAAPLPAFTGHAATKKQENSGQDIDGDSVFTTKVNAAIFNENTLKSLQINVKTNQGGSS